jgi:cyclopropane-fatty-acyl-phospholipid synthase
MRCLGRMRTDASQASVIDLLNRYVESGQIIFNLSNQRISAGRFARERGCQRQVTLGVHNARFFSRLLAYGNLGIGEAFIDGDFEVEQGELQDFLTMLLESRIDEKLRTDWRLLLRVAVVRVANLMRSRRGNVQYHYDQGDELFQAFLDPTLTYSCGYAYRPDDGIEELQLNKLRRICEKLALKPKDRLLDIGCGYGGLLVYTAKNYDIMGMGITISKRHFERASKIVEQKSLSGRVNILLQSYDKVAREYDKIASVGMMEHL